METSKEDAKELTQQKYRLHEIYMKHDVAGFKEFFSDSEEFKSMSDEDISELLHTIKSTNPMYGEEFFKSRRILRLKKWNEDDVKARFPDGEIPLCATCIHFRTAPSEESKACMHLGAIPEDVACHGYEALPK